MRISHKVDYGVRVMAAIATIEPGQSERQSIWAFPYAGLDAR